MWKRGASVGIFLVIGVIILITAGLVVWVMNGTSPKPTNDDVSGYDASEVQSFVNSCLFDSTIAGLRLLGQQGGVIYLSQGGVTPDSFMQSEAILYDGSYILRGILAGDMDSGRSCVPTHKPPIYNPERCPNVAFPFYNTESPEVSMQQLRISPPPADAYVRLLNRVNLRDLYPRTEEFTKMGATFDNLVDNSRDQSVYATLKSFIERNITKCLDFSSLQNVEVTATGQPQVIPIISADFVTVSMKYPLTVKHQSKTISLEKFSAPTRVRFKPLFIYVKYLLENEALDFSFDIGLPQDSPVGVSHIVNKDVVGKADLLQVTDNNSFLPDKGGSGFVPFMFSTFIDNSQPAISYIHYNNLDIVPGLRNRLTHCSLLAEPRNPWEESTTDLEAEIGTTMNRAALTCLWQAYENSLGPGYRRVYEPDGDLLPPPDFKTAHCEWNKPCQYKGENLFLDRPVNLTIRFNDSQYADTLTIPLKLFDHPVEDLRIGRVHYEEEVLAGLDPLIVDLEQALQLLPLVYQVNATDEDIRWGTEVDEIEYSVDVPTVKSEKEELSEIKRRWVVGFMRSYSGQVANFSVRDNYGKSISKTIVLGED